MAAPAEVGKGYDDNGQRVREVWEGGGAGGRTLRLLVTTELEVLASLEDHLHLVLWRGGR